MFHLKCFFGLKFLWCVQLITVHIDLPWHRVHDFIMEVNGKNVIQVAENLPSNQLFKSYILESWIFCSWFWLPFCVRSCLLIIEEGQGQGLLPHYFPSFICESQLWGEKRFPWPYPPSSTSQALPIALTCLSFLALPSCCHSYHFLTCLLSTFFERIQVSGEQDFSLFASAMTPDNYSNSGHTSEVKGSLKTATTSDTSCMLEGSKATLTSDQLATNLKFPHTPLDVIIL